MASIVEKRSRRRSNERARASAYDAGLLAAPAPVVVVALDGTITLCNAAAEELFGVAREDVQRCSIDELVAPLSVIEALTKDGARAVLPCDLPDGGTKRVGVRLGRFPPRAPRAERVLVFDDTPEREEERRARGDPLPFDVVEVLQMAALSHRTLALDVTVDETLYGRILVVDGQPWWARDVHDDGAPAFHRLVFRRTVEVLCARCDPREVPDRNLHGGLEQLLLDAARVRDEERRALDEAELVDDADVFFAEA